MAKVTLGQGVHSVAMFAGMKRIAQQHRVINRSHIHPVTGQHLHIVFRILGDLQNAWILQHWLEHIQCVIQRDLPLGQRIIRKQVIPPTAVQKRNVARLARLDAQRHTDQFRHHLVQRRGFGIEGHLAPGMRRSTHARNASKSRTIS